MAKTYDVIAIGSGHNGLVAAAYFAKAGKKVVVLEKRSHCGGGVITRELTVPGFCHDEHSMAPIFIQANPLPADDELGLLSRHGLTDIKPDVPFISNFDHGASIATCTTGELQ